MAMATNPKSTAAGPNEMPCRWRSVVTAWTVAPWTMPRKK
jgi:hypothetical protein